MTKIEQEPTNSFIQALLGVESHCLPEQVSLIASSTEIGQESIKGFLLKTIHIEAFSCKFLRPDGVALLDPMTPEVK